MSDDSQNTSQRAAFIFPGQGSQSIGMLSDYSETAEVRETFQRASDVLDYDLWDLCQNGTDEQLAQTEKAQPALLTASVALWRVWQTKSALPKLVAGHSLGEYSALVCAGILDFEQAVSLVEKRGLFMQQAVPVGVGKMAAIIGLDGDKVKQACELSEQNEVVSPVNYNSPEQVVIAGNTKAVDRAMDACKENGAKRVMPLTVSVPSHCMLMKPAADQLEDILKSIKLNSSDISVVNNVDVSIETDQDKIKSALVRQLYSPVRWTECIHFIATQGVDQLIECGPGKVLSGLNRRIDRSLTSYQTHQLASLNQSVEALS